MMFLIKGFESFAVETFKTGKLFWMRQMFFYHCHTMILIKKGDTIIVASTGSKAVIGKAGYVDRDIPNVMIGAFLRICRPHTPNIENFLRYIFASEYYRKHIRESSQGTNINNVKETYITELLIGLPPLAEQQRIVAKIEELVPYIEKYGAVENEVNTLNTFFSRAAQKVHSSNGCTG